MREWRRMGRYPYPQGKDCLVVWVPLLKGSEGLFHWGACMEGGHLTPGRWQESPPWRAFYGFVRSKNASHRASMHPHGEVRKAKLKGTLTLFLSPSGEKVVAGFEMLVSKKAWDGKEE